MDTPLVSISGAFLRPRVHITIVLVKVKHIRDTVETYYRAWWYSGSMIEWMNADWGHVCTGGSWIPDNTLLLSCQYTHKGKSQSWLPPSQVSSTYFCTLYKWSHNTVYTCVWLLLFIIFVKWLLLMCTVVNYFSIVLLHSIV